MTAPVRQPSLTDDLPPTAGIDPGARWTAVTLRIGRACPGATTVYNAAKVRPGGDKRLIPATPDITNKVLIAAARLMRDNEAAARAWWADRGLAIPADRSPWLVALEKCREPITDKARGLALTPDVLGVYAATVTLEVSLLTAFGEPTRRVAPHRADDRWEAGRGGTGDPADYWPTNLLDPTDGGIPDTAVVGSTSPWKPDRQDVRAAWHVASDAAQDHVRRYGVTPPHEVYGTPVLVPALHTLLGVAVRPAEPLAAPGGASTRTALRTARTTAPVCIPAPRAPEPESAEVLAEIRRLVAEAEATSRSILEIVREHLDAEQPSPFEAPSVWSGYSARRRALLAAATAA